MLHRVGPRRHPRPLCSSAPAQSSPRRPRSRTCCAPSCRHATAPVRAAIACLAGFQLPSARHLARFLSSRSLIVRRGTRPTGPLARIRTWITTVMVSTLNYKGGSPAAARNFLVVHAQVSQLKKLVALNFLVHSPTSNALSRPARKLLVDGGDGQWICFVGFNEAPAGGSRFRWVRTDLARFFLGQ